MSEGIRDFEERAFKKGYEQGYRKAYEEERIKEITVLIKADIAKEEILRFYSEEEYLTAVKKLAKWMD